MGVGKQPKQSLDLATNIMSIGQGVCMTINKHTTQCFIKFYEFSW